MLPDRLKLKARTDPSSRKITVLIIATVDSSSLSWGRFGKTERAHPVSRRFVGESGNHSSCTHHTPRPLIRRGNGNRLAHRSIWDLCDNSISLPISQARTKGLARLDQSVVRYAMQWASRSSSKSARPLDAHSSACTEKSRGTCVYACVCNGVRQRTRESYHTPLSLSRTKKKSLSSLSFEDKERVHSLCVV